MKRIFSLLLIFVVGGIGGIFLDRFAIPRLAQTSLGTWLPALRRTSERTTIVNKTEVVRVEESEAVPDLADRVKSAVIPIEIARKGSGRSKQQALLAKIAGTASTSTKELATGLALTSDGFILLHLDGFSVDNSSDLRGRDILGISLAEGEGRLPLEVAASDTSTHFVLLRAPGKQLSVLPFKDDIPRLGARLFSLSASMVKDTISPLFQTAMLSAVADDFFEVSSPPGANAIIVDFQGRIAGMNITDSAGKNSIIPASRLRAIGDGLLRKKS